MYKSILVCFFLFSTIYHSFSQEYVEKKVLSKIEQVTVFLKGAQINRLSQVNYATGKSMLKFVGLSPFIIEKSIQVKSSGNFSILSVNLHKNYLGSQNSDQKINQWQQKLEDLQDQVELEKAKIEVLEKRMVFLNQNQNIKGEESLTVTELQAASDFFTQQFTGIKNEQLSKNKKIKELSREINRIEQTITSLNNSVEELPQGEIWIHIDAQNAGSSDFRLTYLVENAGWYPSYDVRVEAIDQPLVLTYKANVYQKTEQDWQDVQIKFSSNDPNKSNIAPELKTYFLNYHQPPPNYDRERINSVTGIVYDDQNKPLIGVNVVVKNTTIGTVTDANGRYSLTLPNSARYLMFSSVGYKMEERLIGQSNINVQMIPDIQQLEELVVVGYGAQKKREMTGSSAEVADEVQGSVRGISTIPVQTEVTDNPTMVEFSVENPYSIPSDGKNYAVNINYHDISAVYQYFCIPRINTDAFLKAHILDWEQYNLLEGEANIYFEDTYIGKSIVDLSTANDTLNLSLGVDKSVVVARLMEEQYTSRQFLGNKQEVTKGWKISVKNNKRQTINLTLQDQVPISTLEEIEVETSKLSGGKMNDNGTVEWQIKLPSQQKEEVELRYSVKFPKGKNLLIQ